MLNAPDIVRRDREGEGRAIVRQLFTGDGAAILEIEDDVRDGLGLRGVPAVRNEALMLVERPACRDPTAGKELPRLGVKRIGRGVIARVRQAAGLILFDPLQLPAQGIAEHLLHLLAAHAAELTIGHAQTLDCDAQLGRYKAGAVKIPGA